MLKRREIVLIILLLVILVAGGFYMFYFKAALEQIDRTEKIVESMKVELEAAKQRVVTYEALKTVRENVVEEWDEVMGSVPDTYDETGLLRFLQSVIYPHTKDISVSFPSGGSSNGTTEIYTLSLGFKVTYDQLIKILTDFEKSAMTNRVVNYSYSRSEDGETGSVYYSVNVQAEYLVR